MSDSGLLSRGFRELREDWNADNINTSAANGVAWLVSSDSSDTAFVRTASAAGIIVTATTAATDDNMCEIGHDTLAWSVQNGALYMEGRCRLDVITNVAFNIGFNDDQLDDSNTLPMELSGTTWTSNAASWIGFVFDTDATNDDVHVMWVDDDNDSGEAVADLRMSGLAPVANEWFSWSILLTDRGSGNGVRAEFNIVEESTGKRMQKAFNTTLDRDVLLTPHIAVENRSATAHVFDIDAGLYVKASRATTN